MACEAYRHNMEYLKPYMQRQWSLVGGMAGTTFRKRGKWLLAQYRNVSVQDSLHLKEIELALKSIEDEKNE